MKRVLTGLIGAFACLALFASQANAAITFTFDPDGAAAGSGPIAGVTGFDYLPDSALAEGGLAAVNALILSGGAVQTPFDTYAHGRLDKLIGTGSGPAPGTEITFVTGFGERPISFSAGPGFLEVHFDDGFTGTNFFELYFDSTPDADPLAGTGYNDGTLILSGLITNVRATSNFSIDDPNAGNLDGVGVDNYPAIDSVGGGGSSKFEGVITFFDPTFFTSGFFVGLNTSLVDSNLATPFKSENPSGAFVVAPGGVPAIPLGAGLPGDLGAVNGQAFVLGGGGGPSFQFQSDANQSFDITPEPGSIALWSIGAMVLVGRGLRSWRRKK